jgi:hypothetical protein
MSAIADYASYYEAAVRPRRRGPRYIWVLAVWTAIFLVRPGLALEIWRQRR